jgi:hypothetical protein
VSGFSPQQKKDPKKEREKEKTKKERKKVQGLKTKRGETSYGEAPCFKRRKEKKMMKFTSCWERFYHKKERKEITFSYSAKSNV